MNKYRHHESHEDFSQVVQEAGILVAAPGSQQIQALTAERCFVSAFPDLSQVTVPDGLGPVAPDGDYRSGYPPLQTMPVEYQGLTPAVRFLMALPSRFCQDIGIKFRFHLDMAIAPVTFVRKVAT